MYYSLVDPDPVKQPRLLLLNTSLADKLGLDTLKLKEKEWLQILAGNKTLKGEKFLAQAYAGHQFGRFTILGDGRAKLVKEHKSPQGEIYDIQLKGTGPTPYSRGGDGRASLGPMLREYMISEAMHSLKIPTTRALALVSSGEAVYRDRPLQGAILTRLAKSHIRVGTFQYGAQVGSFEDLKALADYTISRHFPYLWEKDNPYLAMLKEVIKSQASLIAKWQLVGFIHGVMNTDNMTIGGETIDYGPCAFMDAYDEKTVFSSIDRGGRYSYENQPKIGAWNLARLAEALLPLIHEDEKEALKLANKAISAYYDLYDDFYTSGMRSKLGLVKANKEDDFLIKELLRLMAKYKADYTNTFVSLTLDKFENNNLFMSKEFKDWKTSWQARDICRKTMENHNPLVIPRNHQVEKAIKAAQEGDLTKASDLMKVLSKPFAYNGDLPKDYMSPPPAGGGKYQTFCGT